MTDSKQTRLVVLGAAVLAALALGATLYFSPPKLSLNWLEALGILLIITLISQLLALRITAAGSVTTMDFVPHLGAILLVGPSGAALLTLASYGFFRFGPRKSPPTKALFNTAQLVISVIAAAWTYILLNGLPTLGDPTTETLTPFIFPFLAAVIVYFATNTGSVSYIISLSQDEPFLDVWSRLSGRLILFDLAISPLAYLVAFMYWRYGAIALLFAIIPIIGLRYSYGVNLELQQLNTDLARVLIKTIESQDPYTGGHSLRVARWSKAIADKAGLSYEQKRNIETAALLHDIGKIDRKYFQILRQKGPLTEEQRRLIRIHPERGVDMLSTVRSLDENVLEYIKHHHERFDGQGYPDGVPGNDIPLGARIIAIADTVDAMMTRRPYRDALPAHVVKSELKDQKGQQFDPQLIEIIMSTGLFDQMASTYTTGGDSDSDDRFDSLNQEIKSSQA